MGIKWLALVYGLFPVLLIVAIEMTLSTLYSAPTLLRHNWRMIVFVINQRWIFVFVFKKLSVYRVGQAHKPNDVAWSWEEGDKN